MIVCRVQSKPHNGALASSLVLAVFLFGANNTAVTYLVRYWPPILVGASRFLASGLVLLAIVKWTRIFGPAHRLTPELNRGLWVRTGLSMAAYIIVFNTALKMAPISHVALYLGAAPVWALLWEGQPERHWKSVQRYGAAALAFSGVLTLFWPILRNGSSGIIGEILGLASSILWTFYGRQCRSLGNALSGAEIAAYTFLRAGLLLTPLAAVLCIGQKIPWRGDLFWSQMLCIFGGGVAASALWNNALRHWKTSQVYLFNNLIPISTMSWAHLWLGEPITRTFWIAMALIGGGVILGQANLQRLFGSLWMPAE